MKAVVRTNEDLLKFINTVSDRLDGRPWTISLKKFHRPRTLPANAKFHAMNRELALHLGYSESQMKSVIKSEFGPIESTMIGPRIVDMPKETAEYTVTEMQAMIEQLYQLGAEVGCVFQSDQP